MKILTPANNFRSLILILFFTLTASQNAFPTGTEGGNGGSWVAREFVLRAWDLLTFISKPGNNLDQLDLKDFRDLLGKVRVSVSDQLLKDKNGLEVDAINFFPSRNEIILDRAHWVQYLFSGMQLSGLVYHELLPYFKKDDTNYTLSRKLNQKIVGAQSPISFESLQYWISMQNMILLTAADTKTDANRDPELNQYICYRLGEYNAETQLALEVLAAKLKQDSKPAPDASKKVSEFQEFSNGVAGLISFCKSGWMAVPKADDGNPSSYAAKAGDLRDLTTRLTDQKRYLLTLSNK